MLHHARCGVLRLRWRTHSPSCPLPLAESGTPVHEVATRRRSAPEMFNRRLDGASCLQSSHLVRCQRRCRESWEPPRSAGRAAAAAAACAPADGAGWARQRGGAAAAERGCKLLGLPRVPDGCARRVRTHLLRLNGAPSSRTCLSRKPSCPPCPLHPSRRRRRALDCCCCCARGGGDDSQLPPRRRLAPAAQRLLRRRRRGCACAAARPAARTTPAAWRAGRRRRAVAAAAPAMRWWQAAERM